MNVIRVMGKLALHMGEQVPSARPSDLAPASVRQAINSRSLCGITSGRLSTMLPQVSASRRNRSRRYPVDGRRMGHVPDGPVVQTTQAPQDDDWDAGGVGRPPASLDELDECAVFSAQSLGVTDWRGGPAELRLRGRHACDTAASGRSPRRYRPRASCRRGVLQDRPHGCVQRHFAGASGLQRHRGRS